MVSISIAMTTFNGENYIEKQLNSILQQTCLPNEVIIIDDCSTDKTPEIVQNFILNNQLEASWFLIRLSENKGHIYSFNLAIEKTNGDIIFLCDQDDVWLPNKINLIADKMIENPNILSLNSSFIKINDKDEFLKEAYYPFSSNNGIIRRKIGKGRCVKIHSKMVITYNISPGCTSAFRSEIKDIFLKSSKQLDKNSLVHDWKINFIASLHGGLYFLNIPTTLYRLHSQNTIGLSRAKKIDARLNSYKKAIQERQLMLGILSEIMNSRMYLNDDVDDIKNYINKLIKTYKDRCLALEHRNFFQCFTNIIKNNLFQNRAFESDLMDIYLIIKNKLKQ